MVSRSYETSHASNAKHEIKKGRGDFEEIFNSYRDFTASVFMCFRCNNRRTQCSGLS